MPSTAHPRRGSGPPTAPVTPSGVQCSILSSLRPPSRGGGPCSVAVDDEGVVWSLGTADDQAIALRLPETGELVDTARPREAPQGTLTHLLHCSGTVWAVSDAGEALLFDARTRAQRGTVLLSPEPVRAAAVRGERVFVVTPASCRVCDADGACLRWWSVPPDATAIAALTADVVATGHGDGGVRWWGAERGQLLREQLAAHAGEVTAMLPLPAPAGGRPDAEVPVLTAGADGMVRLWHGGGAAAELRGHSDRVSALAAVDPLCTLVASAGADGRILLWDIRRLRSVGALDQHRSSLQSLVPVQAVSTAVLWSAGADSSVTSWAIRTRAAGTTPADGAALTAMSAVVAQKERLLRVADHQLVTKEAELADREAELAGTAEQLAAAEGEIGRLAAVRDEIGRLKEAHGAEVAGLRAELRKASEAAERMQEDARRADESGHSELRQEGAARMRAEGRAAEAEERAAEAESAVRSLTEELSAARAAAAGLRDDCDGARSRCAAAEEELRDRAHELDTVRSDARYASVRHSDERKRLAAAVARLRQAVVEVAGPVHDPAPAMEPRAQTRLVGIGSPTEDGDPLVAEAESLSPTGALAPAAEQDAAAAVSDLSVRLSVAASSLRERGLAASAAADELAAVRTALDDELMKADPQAPPPPPPPAHAADPASLARTAAAISANLRLLVSAHQRRCADADRLLDEERDVARRADAEAVELRRENEALSRQLRDRETDSASQHSHLPLAFAICARDDASRPATPTAGADRRLQTPPLRAPAAAPEELVLLRQALDSKGRDYQQLQQELVANRARLDDKHRRMQQLQEQAEQRARELQQERHQGYQRLRELTQLKREMKARGESPEREAAEMRAKLREADAALGNAQDLRKLLEARLERAEADAAGLRGKVERAESDRDAARQDLAAAQQELTAARAEKDALAAARRAPLFPSPGRRSITVSADASPARPGSRPSTRNISPAPQSTLSAGDTLYSARALAGRRSPPGPTRPSPAWQPPPPPPIPSPSRSPPDPRPDLTLSPSTVSPLRQLQQATAPPTPPPQEPVLPPTFSFPARSVAGATPATPTAIERRRLQMGLMAPPASGPPVVSAALPSPQQPERAAAEAPRVPPPVGRPTVRATATAGRPVPTVGRPTARTASAPAARRK
eukprot:TRINITY_DN2392_c1_g1_i1.p1 TRINITY_DN2392_c1_g1~~TRINITY_DN2392_c1_g1_i1.p1  ORF type:complete len:1170 (+),score=527.19 TRINITY_DN2392_c1_g1_i1:45-3512(+)